jgi:hypothetical protein
MYSHGLALFGGGALHKQAGATQRTPPRRSAPAPTQRTAGNPLMLCPRMFEALFLLFWLGGGGLYTARARAHQCITPRGGGGGRTLYEGVPGAGRVGVEGAVGAEVWVVKAVKVVEARCKCTRYSHGPGALFFFFLTAAVLRGAWALLVPVCSSCGCSPRWRPRPVSPALRCLFPDHVL